MSPNAQIRRGRSRNPLSVLAVVMLLLSLGLVAAGPAQAAPATWRATVTLGNGAGYTGAGAGTAVPTSPLITGDAAAIPGAAAFDARRCLAGTLDPAKVAGKIVLCENGTNATTEKSAEVRRAGGVGMLLADPGAGPLTADAQSVPTIHVDAAAGVAVRAYVAGTPAPTAAFSAGQRVFASSATTLTSSANPSTAGQPVTFTATVDAGSLTPTGSVAFRNGGSPIPGCETVALTGAQATCTTAALGAGSHAIEAAYSGDEGLRPSSATLTQQVDAPAVNREPRARPDLYTTRRGRTLTIAAPGVLANDADADGDQLTVSRVLGPARGTLVLRRDGGFTYTPRPGYTGVDGFVYRISDGRGGTALGVVAIAVTR